MVGGAGRVMRDPDAVFFDMDGTLLDRQVGMDESWMAACEAGCPRLPGIAATALYDAVRAKRDWFWAHPVHRVEGRMDLDRATRIIVTEAVASLGVDAPDVAAAIAADYRTRRDACIVLYDGAERVLDEYRRRGLKMALITNGNAISQRRSVDRFGLARYFDCILIEGEFGCGKPEERVFRHALDSCRVDPERTWMIGDNLEADIVTPHRLGMHTIWVDAESRGVPDGAPVQPHRVVRAVRELLDGENAPTAS
jgi:putative hydrolase of the HAD superfamily